MHPCSAPAHMARTAGYCSARARLHSQQRRAWTKALPMAANSGSSGLSSRTQQNSSVKTARLDKGAADGGEQRVQRVEQPHAAELFGEAAPVARRLDRRARPPLRQRLRHVPECRLSTLSLGLEFEAAQLPAGSIAAPGHRFASASGTYLNAA